MKKQFTQLCIAMAILLGISTASKAQYTLYLDSINNVCTVGTKVEVSIRTRNFNTIPILTYQGTVQYDTAVLALDSIYYSGKSIALNDNSILSDTVAGQLGFLWNDPSLNQTGQKAVDASPLATLRFRIKKLIIGNSSIYFDTTAAAAISWNIGYYDATLGAVTATNTGHLAGYVNFVSQPTISKSGGSLLTAVPSGVPSTYQWNLNGNPISGATSSTYNFGAVSGSYTVTVNYSNGCTATSAPLLPIIVTQFNGFYKSGASHLTWSTINSNAAYFNVQRSVNGKDFTTINQVNSVGSAFAFSDATNESGKVYYRLQIVDKDGGISYSNIVTLALSSATSFSIYPNPVRSTLSLQVQSSKTELVTVQVVDLLGKVLHQEQSQLSAGLNNISFSVASLSRGNYVVVVKGSNVLQQQFIKY